MRRWACRNCGREWFAEDQPTGCDCGLDVVAEPRFANLLVEMVVLHFDPPHPVVAGAGRNVLACDPARRVGTGPRATGEASQVTCPACRKTPEWQKAYRGDPVFLASEDEQITAKGGVLTSPCE